MTDSPAHDTRPDLRRHARETVALGLPLVGSQLAQHALHVTDTIMVGWYSVEALAGLVLATTFFFVLFLLGMGFAIAVMPMVASAAGTENDVQVRRVTRMGIWVSVLTGVFAIPPMLMAEPILLRFGQEPVVAAEAGRYLGVAAWGFVPALVVMVLRSYFTGLGRTRAILLVTIGVAVLNVPLNYALIFGNWGAPEMGVVGAAVASVVCNLIGLLALGLHAVRATPQYALFRNFHRPDREAFGQVFRLGWPIGLTYLAEVGLFSFASILVGWVGTVPLAAHGIALQIASVTFSIHVGLSQAATVRAGRAFGQRDEPGLRTGAAVALVLSMAVVVATILAFLTVPEALIGIFVDPADPERGAILAIGATLLAMAALFQLVDAGQAMALGMLRGVQDTKVPMVMAGVAYWAVGAPASYMLGFPAGGGAVGIWAGLVIGLAGAALTLSWRFWMRSSRIGA